VKVLVPALLIASLACSALGVEIGDKAPPLSANAWLNGSAAQPDKPDGKTIYVIEFWATWCPPCRQSIPHLNKLLQEYKDRNVVIVGVTDEPEDVVRPFVRKLDMQYLVAIAPKEANGLWTEGIPGIPQAFIVDSKGTIVWAGHPMAGLDDALKGIFEGTYDAEKVRTQAAQEEDLKGLLSEGDFAKALKKVDAMIAKNPKDFALCQLKLELLAQLERFEQVKKFYREIYKTFSDSAEEMNTLAWIAATSPFEMGDLDIAWEAATRAVQLSNRENSAILDTLARVYYATGLFDEAVKAQEEALKKSKDKEERADLESALSFYKSAVALRQRISNSPQDSKP
jgi:tetratricopeptide (TPR) repeat protein